jgi:hypothetical protein
VLYKNTRVDYACSLEARDMPALYLAWTKELNFQGTSWARKGKHLLNPNLYHFQLLHSFRAYAFISIVKACTLDVLLCGKSKS